MFKRQGAYFDGYIVCPHVTPEYANKNKQYKFDKRFVDPKCNCLKPNTGMVEEAFEKKKLNPKNTNVYVIGDRESDVLTALNSRGVGILVPFKNRIEEIKKVEKLKKKHKNQVFIARDFKGAVKCIIDKEK